MNETRVRFALVWFHLVSAVLILVHRHKFTGTGYWVYRGTVRPEDDVWVKPSCDICGAERDR